MNIEESGKCYSCGMPTYIIEDRLQCIAAGCGGYSKGGSNG